MRPVYRGKERFPPRPICTSVMFRPLIDPVRQSDYPRYTVLHVYDARVLVGGGARREAIPDLDVIDPLVDGKGGRAVERAQHDAVDGGVVDPHVGSVVIDDHLA